MRIQRFFIKRTTTIEKAFVALLGKRKKNFRMGWEGFFPSAARMDWAGFEFASAAV